MRLIPGESSAAACRRLGWGPGTVLEGDQGYGTTRIRITAVGETSILAVAVARRGKPVSDYETTWTLHHRDWHRADAGNVVAFPPPRGTGGGVA